MAGDAAGQDITGVGGFRRPRSWWRVLRIVLLVLTGVPLGLGLIWWLARERPWYPADQPPPDASGRDQRDRWYVGLLIGIATSIAASGLLYGLRRLLGAWYVPHGAGN